MPLRRCRRPANGEAPVTRRPRHWIVAYDVSDPRRLKRVHRYLAKRGEALQYSVFSLWLDEPGLDRVMDGLARLIDPTRDDVRAWAVPPRGSVDVVGIGRLPDGITLVGRDSFSATFPHGAASDETQND